MYKLNLFKSDKGRRAKQWRWNITHQNGNILAQGEYYHNKEDLLNMINNLFSHAEIILDQTKEY